MGNCKFLAEIFQSKEDFVTHIMLHPRIIVQFLPHPLLEALE